ncbi:hypothetical protein FNV43_RR03223 [Rhamnella rubrinervis]|uniref:Uncharacterized protein n=1 Tax=Rhamnella rubrinervis TaxID=2594499 RepID=A0A8K0HJD0_9ROSA|nr:hypothetical protein FNV43_RR03223 [Rhamnella rubrinervis]
MMEYHCNVHFHDPEEADGTLSPSELPLLIKAEAQDKNLSRNQGQEICFNSNHAHPTRRSPITGHQASELFDFFISSSDSIMCSAEDVIILCGKQSALRQRSDSLPVPFKDKPIYPLSSDDHKREAAFQRRSGSAPQLQSRTKTKPTLRNSQSLDYRKHQRPEKDRNSSFKGVVKSDMPPKVAAAKPQPPWSSLIFRMPKVSREMKLSDIKSRQSQRIASNLEAGGKHSVSQSSGKGYWRFLKALSCNNLGSVAVTASFFDPQALTQ